MLKIEWHLQGKWRLDLVQSDFPTVYQGVRCYGRMGIDL